jgi:hypothetical protein
MDVTLIKTKLNFVKNKQGAVYFKSLYKVQVFGVCEDGTPRQVSNLWFLA